MTLHAPFAALSLMCLATACAGRADTGGALADLDLGEPACLSDTAGAAVAWEKFRTTHWLHAQGVAKPAELAGGCHVFIVAEPPPTIGLADLTAAAPGLLRSGRTYRHGIGLDGWTQDAVFITPPLPERRRDELISALHIALFGTSYGAQALAFDGRMNQPLGDAVDLRIKPEDLEYWVLESDARFSPLLGADGRTGPELLASAPPGVYYDAGDTIVAWVIANDADMSKLRRDARWFAVDTDLVVGGIKGSANSLVIGRRRQVDGAQLSPLRFETLALLASVPDDALAQSFERQNLMAGRYSDGMDWAPILLSPALRDSEFGSVLNIADQLLKSWSNNGAVEYANFTGYPAPKHWGFDRPVVDTARALKLATIRFMFTSENFGEVLRSPTHGSMTFASTAALGTVYVDDSVGDQPATRDLARTGAQFFAQVGDPYIVRAAQYSAFYQLVKNFGLQGHEPLRTDTEEDASTLLERHFTALLATFDQASPDLRKSLEAKHYERLLIELPADRRFKGLSPAELERNARHNATRHTDEQLQRYRSTLDQIRPDLPKLLQLGLRRDPRGPAEQDRHLLPKLASLSDLKEALLMLVEIDAFSREYSSVVTDEQARWIHTPSSLRSRVTLLREGVINIGGHSIGAYARVTPREERGAYPVALPPATALKISETKRRGLALGWASTQRPEASPGIVVTLARSGFTVSSQTRSFAARTQLDVVDLLGNLPSPTALSVELRGFSEAERQAMVRSFERRWAYSQEHAQVAFVVKS